MQANVSNPRCPLCKGAVFVAGGGNGATRLCDECCAMIARVRPQSSAEVYAGNFPLPSIQPIAHLDVSYEPDVPFPAPPPAPVADFNGAPQGAASQETLFSTSEPPRASRFEPASPVQPYVSTPTLEFDNLFAPSPMSSPIPSAPPIAPAPPTPRVAVEMMEEQPWAPSPNPFLVQEPPQSSQAPPTSGAPFAFQAIGGASAAAENGAPFGMDAPARRLDGTVINDVPPSWDAPEEFPILMVQKEEKSFAKLLAPIAALLLVAVLVAGYFFVYQPYFAASNADATPANGYASVNPPAAEPPQQPPAEAASQTPDATVATPPEASGQAAAETPANAPAAEPPAAGQTPETAAVGEGATASPTNGQANGQGKFSLQAASFPTQAGAQELSEKLVRAGVPAYITSANLAAKGMWYRVRVGRFMTSADAEKYAVQAKQRAKGAGLNVQLVICEYSL